MRQAAGEAHSDRPCVAALVYVYDHATRELAKRLADTFHHRHDLPVSTLHIHLDHETCMEVTVPKGQSAEVRHFAEHVIAERGVRHGQLVMVPDHPTSRTSSE